MAQQSTKRQRGDRNPVHEQRRAMVNGFFNLPEENKKAMSRIREIFQKAADDYLEVVDQLEQRDEGRVTAVLDLIQQTKNVGCDAVIVCFGPTQKAEK
jgi:hypothetical protein